MRNAKPVVIEGENALLRFATHAMATEFQILFPALGADIDYLERATQECFQDLAVLEGELSRYREHSDVGRVLHLAAGESTPIGMAAYDCLGLAKAAHEATDGAFDITVGPLMDLWRGELKDTFREPSDEELASVLARVGSDKFSLSDPSQDPGSYQITVEVEGLSIDLGAIGKGYALDQMGHKLQEWGIRSAVLSASESTILGVGEPPQADSKTAEGWAMGAGTKGVRLNNSALSGSGFEEQGGHIMDPRQARPIPVDNRNAWALAPNAAMADALSTAFLVMKRKEIEELCLQLDGVEAILSDDV